MVERRVLAPDLHQILRAGAVVDTPEWDEKWQNWKCLVEGPDPDGRIIRVVVGLRESEDRLVIITVYPRS